MSVIRTVICNACGKEIKDRHWLSVSTYSNVTGKHADFDICSECTPLFNRTLTIGLGRATDGYGRRLIVTTKEEE